MRTKLFKTGCLSLLLMLLCAGLQGVDFSYEGPDCRIIYRFIPRTGTLEDLLVIYNEDFRFFPSYSGGITKFFLGGEELQASEGRHASAVLAETHENNTYRAKFRWTYKDKSFVFHIRIWLEEKTLFIEFFTNETNDRVAAFGLGRSEQTPDPKVISLPYGHNVLFTNGVFLSAIIDPFLSNASTLYPVTSPYSSTSAFFGPTASYEKRTDGRRNPLRETVRITVSPRISDTFYHPPNPVSPYREALRNRVIVDLWRNDFEEYRHDIQRLAQMGLRDLFIIIHMWQKYGYDNGLPTTFPAGEMYGGESGLRSVMELCEKNGYLCALHTNYVDFYPNSDDWNPNDIALDSQGNGIPSWTNPVTGLMSYLMKPSRCIHYARLYEPLIHDSYRTTAAYLDVHSAVLPSFKVDYDAAVPESGTQSSTLHAYTHLMRYVRNVHSGPLAGEGFGFSAPFWAGYIDAMEADPRSLSDVSEGRDGTDAPLIVDYKLQVLHDLFVPHGAGYLERFYGNKPGGYTQKELERYRITELAFGNAGFLSNPFLLDIPESEILREYCFLKHLQQEYLLSPPDEILYQVGGELLDLSSALRYVLPSIPQADVPETLNRTLSMLKITYPDGFTLHVNRSFSKNWDILHQAVLYRLPPNGFLAFKGDELLAYSAIIDGEKHTLICPAEPVCCTVVFPPESFSGKSVINRSLSQKEIIHLLRWKPNPKNRRIQKYRIYRLEETRYVLLAEVGSGVREFWVRNVSTSRPSTYAVTAVNADNKESDPALLTLQ